MNNKTKTFSIPRFRLLFAILFFVYTVTLFISTHVKLPKNALPGGTDKIAHFVAYAGLSFLLLIWISAKRMRSAKEILIAVVCCLLFGAVDELLQIPVGRSCDFYDWVADCVGVFIGVVFFLGVRFFTPSNMWVQKSEEPHASKDRDEHKL